MQDPLERQRRRGAFHDGAAGHPAHRGMIHGLAAAGAARREPAGNHAALGYGINLAVGALSGA